MIREKLHILRNILTIITCVILFLGCSNTTTHESFWYVDEYNAFHTNDIEKAQNEIPFKIIIPEYLPDTIPPEPYMIAGPIKGVVPDDETEIMISFPTNSEGDYLVNISEMNRNYTTSLSSGVENSLIDIGGFEVLEFNSGYYLTSPEGDSRYVTAIEYEWNADNKHYSVRVSGYGKEEAVKIVESMIDQLNNP